MAETKNLSDKAVAVFAFAAYHELTSGQPVKSVIRDDGKGHKADPDAVAELGSLGLAKLNGNDIAFSEAGLQVLATAIEGLKDAARAA